MTSNRAKPTVRWAALLVMLAGAGSAFATECAVLLHGLNRSDGSMSRMASALTEAGFLVVNVDYPSTDMSAERLAGLAISTGVLDCRAAEAEPVHFVTHSLGGILIRVYTQDLTIPSMGRTVMLGPPNQGSELVDVLQDKPGFDWINGPVGRQLGTGPDDLPAQLGPANFEVGVIAGNRTVNPFSPIVPKPNDGTVSVASARLEGMADFIVLSTNHTFMARNKEVIRQTIYFLRNGSFDCQGTECTQPDPAQADINLFGPHP